jgi:taurine dioxygenase
MSKLHIKFNPSGIGVRIHGLDLAAPLTAAATLEIQRLLHAYRLVVFEYQVLGDRQLCEFAYRFGPPFFAPNGHPVLGSSEHVQEVVVVGNKASEYGLTYLGHQEVLPHSDHQWLRCPSAASLLYAVDIAPGSASTTWTDMAAAYTLLDDDTKARIENLQLITYNPFHRPFGSVRAHYVNRDTETVPGEVFPHPLVRTHPATREKVLYLHSAYEMELAGIGYLEGRALIEGLHQHMYAVSCKYEHVWQNGDLVLWDNQATVHYRPSFREEVRRVLKRVSIGGGAPY